jgi:hypothetical protein
MSEEYDKGYKDGFEEGLYASEVLDENEYERIFKEGFNAGLEAAKQSIINLKE